MTLKELQPQLLALTPEEKSQAIQILVQSLSNTWQGIEKNPRVMGGDACIRQTRIPVWLLVSLQRQGASEAYILEDYPTLSAEVTWREFLLRRQSKIGTGAQPLQNINFQYG